MNFTFTFHVIKVEREKAEKIMDFLVSMFELMGFKLDVDFSGGMNITEE